MCSLRLWMWACARVWGGLCVCCMCMYVGVRYDFTVCVCAFSCDLCQAGRDTEQLVSCTRCL
jgi:hypothetical protein